MGEFPRQLVAVSGPIDADKLDGVAAGMGAWGDHTRSLLDKGIVSPDMICGQTLFLLSNQPRNPNRAQHIPGGAGGVAGGVWVRERYTIHRPLERTDVFTVTGQTVGRHVRKGRRYGNNTSQTFDSSGNLVASNISTGLMSYVPDPDLADGAEGITGDELVAVGPDGDAAMSNPHLDRLAELSVGDVFGGHDVTVSLEMMAARDTKNPSNPIHSDPELAKKAGLRRPIAGGNHVLSFVLEVLMDAIGTEGLLHGSSFDVRWKAPVEDGVVIVPTATVIETGDSSGVDMVVFDTEARLGADGPVAMTARVCVPAARS
ncbi:MAG: MaoC family dehydratase [Acidimicrobiales bacterium]|nr:MaoC family dehydratase [Acidimicrobiales bacterium]